MTGQGRASRIVIADSDRALLEMLQIRLALAGYEPHPARTGVAALELMQTQRPALAIIDLQLPDLDGFGVLEEFHLREGQPPFKIMAMARQLGNADIRRAAVLGVRACVAKPFSGADMLDRVSKLLHGARTTSTKEVVWV